jgi:hypothetical protein
MRPEGERRRLVEWLRVFRRGRKEEDWPEKARIGSEIMKLLVERETSLADALDVLTRVMLGGLAAKYGKRDEFSLFFAEVIRFPAPTERDRAVGIIPKKHPGTSSLETTVLTRTVAMIQEPERVRLAFEVSDIITKRAPSLPDGLEVLTGTMLTAIEATCGRERADEFDLLVRAFSRWVISTGERVQ